MTSSSLDDPGERILVFAPGGCDPSASAEILERSGLCAELCPTLASLVTELDCGACAVFVAEEGLYGRDITTLLGWVERQPPWSDLPFVVLTSRQDEPMITAWRRRLVQNLRNVSLLERPVQPITLASTLQTAVRARFRQYGLRDMLELRERAAAELEALVVARTGELEQANNELREQMAERTRVEETLRQAQRIEAIGQLTGGVAHDFNNLLMVILGGFDMLERHSDMVRRRRLLDSMRQAAERGARLTRQLLTFSRRQSLQPEPVDLIRLIDGMGELLDRSLRGDVQVEARFAEALWLVEVDPGELELVLLNLAVNARDAMPAGGTIIIRADNESGWRGDELAGDFVRLSVIDTGIGMAPEVKAHALEPFFTTNEIGKGSGLGLAQAYGFAKQSGGTVRIESELGHGTTISLFLPRVGAATFFQAQSAAGRRGGGRLSNPSGNVLVIEDDDEVADLVAEMFGELGYEVIRAATASSALGALANGRKIDLVFSDIMMPGGMNGIELAREIRNRRRDLPILLTSGYPAQAQQGAELLGVSVLPKPYRLEELENALHQLIGGVAHTSH